MHVLERLNEGIERRTQVARVVPDAGRCPRLVRASAVGAHEDRPGAGPT
jgi:transposase-like protein